MQEMACQPIGDAERFLNASGAGITWDRAVASYRSAIDDLYVHVGTFRKAR